MNAPIDHITGGLGGVRSVRSSLALPQLAPRMPAPDANPSGAPADHSPPPAPGRVRASRRLLDSHGRAIRDLRLSVTDRCNFRCTYCMEPDTRFMDAHRLLAPEDFIRIARVAESLGIQKIRLTGGEPTLHPHLTRIIQGIASATSVELAMITNGSRIDRPALRAWRGAGLQRITISLDSLRPDRLSKLTRSACTPDMVLGAARLCIEEGLTPLKLNAVLLRDVNDDEAADLAWVARELGVEMRFIEFMPLDAGHSWDPGKWVSAAETRARIETRYPLVECANDDPASTSRTYEFADGSPGRVGFIAPLSSPFCRACSRLRITADGMVRPCLFSTTEWNLLPLIRGGESDHSIADFLIDAAWTKQPGHGVEAPEFLPPRRSMSAIGG